MLDQLSKNITRCGLSNSTLNYLRVSVRRSCSSARPALQKGELWGSGSAKSHKLTAWLTLLLHRHLPLEELGLWDLHFAGAQSIAI